MKLFLVSIQDPFINQKIVFSFWRSVLPDTPPGHIPIGLIVQNRHGVVVKWLDIGSIELHVETTNLRVIVVDCPVVDIGFLA